MVQRSLHITDYDSWNAHKTQKVIEMPSDGIDRTIAEKERGLLEQDYATPCPKCGGVVFEWWDSDTCRDCEGSNDETDTEQTTLMTDGGTVKDGTGRFEKHVSGREKVAFEREFGIVHDPDTECGSNRPMLAPETLGEDERWLCRRCFGYPGTADELDALLREKSGSDLPDGPGTLAGWTV